MFMSELALQFGFCSTVLVRFGHQDYENSKLIWGFPCLFSHSSEIFMPNLNEQLPVSLILHSIFSI